MQTNNKQQCEIKYNRIGWDRMGWDGIGWDRTDRIA